MTPGLSQPSKL